MKNPADVNNLTSVAKYYGYSIVGREQRELNITEIKIRKTYEDTRFKALVSVTLDNDFAVHDIKVIQGPDRLFVAMPSRKDDNGVYRDITHPITAEARRYMEESILSAYREKLQQEAAENKPTI